MVVACHCEGRGWNFWGDSNLKGKFWGRSIQLDPVGILTLQFDDGEMFQWSKVTTSIYNIIIGKIYCDHYGTMRIKGSGQYSCKLKFKEQSIIDRNPHQVSSLFLKYYLFTFVHAYLLKVYQSIILFIRSIVPKIIKLGRYLITWANSGTIHYLPVYFL